MAELSDVKDLLRLVMENRELKYRQVEDSDSRYVLLFDMNLNKSRLNSCRELVIATANEIQTYAVCPIRARADVMPTVAEYITRANWNLKVGGFEMDYNDGEVRYHCCLPCAGGEPDAKCVDLVVVVAFLMMERYGDGLLKALTGFGEPKLDVAMAEDQ